MRKTSDEIRVADSRKYFHLLQRNKVANIHLAHLIPAFQVILILSPSPHSWFPFLSIPLATWNAIEEILYCTRFVFEHDSYVFRVYIYIYICICIIYSVLSWYRFVSIIVTLGNMRRKNLWIMCIFVIFVGDKFGLERSMKDTVICKIHIY